MMSLQRESGEGSVVEGWREGSVGRGECRGEGSGGERCSHLDDHFESDQKMKAPSY